ncbi:MAG: fibronectin type III domain-containing protein [Bacteroidales bacterium]|nr:fibronectin type III domain-containing protein [Bacteroidales bacterium]
MDPLSTLDYPREFAPTGLTVENKDFKSATLAWSAIAGGSTNFLLQIYYDSLVFEDNPLMEFNISNEYKYVVTDLNRNTQYSARIKTLAEEGKEESKWRSVAFKTSKEQILTGISKVKSQQADVSWRAGEAVTHLLFTPGNIEVTLAPEDIAAGTKHVTGLSSSTNYKVLLYNGELERGNGSFTTLWRPTGENIKELSLGDDLLSEVADVNNIGKILILSDGYELNTSVNGTKIAGDMTIMSDPDAEERAKLSFTLNGGGKTLFTLPATASLIYFLNLEIEHATTDNGASFIDHQSGDGACTIDTFKFENCYVHGFRRAFVRLRDGGNLVKNIIVNNSIFEDFMADGSNGAFLYDNGTGLFENIVFTNSSLIKLGDATGGTTVFRLNAGQTTHLMMSNCSLYGVIGGNGTERFLFQGVSGSTVDFTKCLLTKTNIAGGATKYAHEISAGATISGSGNIKTSDWTASTTTPAKAESQELVGVTAISQSAENIFEDPANGNLKIKSSAPASVKEIGDPRWRP